MDARPAPNWHVPGFAPGEAVVGRYGFGRRSNRPPAPVEPVDPSTPDAQYNAGYAAGLKPGAVMPPDAAPWFRAGFRRAEGFRGVRAITLLTGGEL